MGGAGLFSVIPLHASNGFLGNLTVDDLPSVDPAAPRSFFGGADGVLRVELVEGASIEDIFLFWGGIGDAHASWVCGWGAEEERFWFVKLWGVDDVVGEAGGLALLLEFLHRDLSKFYDIIIGFL